MIYSTLSFHKIFVTVFYFLISSYLNYSHYITHKLLVVYSIKQQLKACACRVSLRKFKLKVNNTWNYVLQTSLSPMQHQNLCFDTCLMTPQTDNCNVKLKLIQDLSNFVYLLYTPVTATSIVQHLHFANVGNIIRT